MKIIKRNWSIIILLISTVAIGSALIAENIFNISPCKMCLYQRYPYYFIIFISLIFLLFKKFFPKLYVWLIELSLIIGMFFSMWHVGIEQNILPGLSNCTSKIKKTDSLINLKNQILKQTAIPCDEISWSIIGFSAATINSLLLISLFLINTKFLTENYYDKEKNK